MVQSSSKLLALIVILVCSVLLIRRPIYPLREFSPNFGMFKTAGMGTVHATSPRDYTRILEAGAASNIDLGKAKKLAQDLLGLIRARYQLDEPIGAHFFNSANNIGR